VYSVVKYSVSYCVQRRAITRRARPLLRSRAARYNGSARDDRDQILLCHSASVLGYDFLKSTGVLDSCSERSASVLDFELRIRKSTDVPDIRTKSSDVLDFISDRREVRVFPASLRIQSSGVPGFHVRARAFSALPSKTRRHGCVSLRIQSSGVPGSSSKSSRHGCSRPASASRTQLASARITRPIASQNPHISIRAQNSASTNRRATPGRRPTNRIRHET